MVVCRLHFQTVKHPQLFDYIISSPLIHMVVHIHKSPCFSLSFATEHTTLEVLVLLS
jgi:hypothetical protein